MYLSFLIIAVVALGFILIGMWYRIVILTECVKDQISILASKEVLDNDSKKLTAQRFSEIKYSIIEFEEKFRTRTSLILDRMDDLNRVCLKKEEFDRIFELIRREKIILDDAIERVDKKKWDNLKAAFSNGKEQKE